MSELPKFSIGDKVKRKAHARHHRHTIGEVVRISNEIDYPGHGPARKIYWECGALGVVWDWDFELEAW